MRNNEVDCDVSNSYALSIKAQANEIHTQGVYLIFKEGGHFDVSQAWETNHLFLTVPGKLQATIIS